MTNPVSSEFITAPVRIIQGQPYPIRIGAAVRYDGLPFTVAASERNATVLRLAAPDDATGVHSVWITVPVTV